MSQPSLEVPLPDDVTETQEQGHQNVCWNSNGHSMSASLKNSDSFLPNRIQKSRCTKPTSKGPSRSKLGDRHIEINAAALDAFLRQYAVDLDEVTSLGAANDFDISHSNTVLALTTEIKDGEVEDARDGLLRTDYSSGRRTPNSWESPLLEASVTNSFDLIALVPPSALTQYLPQADFAHELLDAFFRELASAKLMFDQRSVVQRYRTSTLPNQILFAMLALGSLYYAAPPSPANQGRKEGSNGSIQQQGRVWAELASQMALAKSDVSTLTTVRTCEHIALYWYAVGERARANFLSDISYREYQNMITSNTYREKEMKFNRAIWLHDSFSEFQKPYRDSIRFMLLYPRLDSFIQREILPPAGTAFNNSHQGTWSDSMSPDDYRSTKYAVGTVGLWREVNAFLREAISAPTIIDFALPAVEKRLQRLHDALPGNLKANSLMEFQLAGPDQDAMLSFTLIHCANMICLHSLRIPNLITMKHVSIADSKTSQRIVVDLAQLAGALVNEHISSSTRGRKIPAMVGTAVFAIGAVLAHMNEFRDGPGLSEPWIYGASCLILLEYITTYWPVLAGLCKKLRRRFSYSDPNMMTISTKLLWQMVTRPDVPDSEASTDQFTTGFFSIPHSASFAHEMLGLDSDAKNQSTPFKSSAGLRTNGSMSMNQKPQAPQGHSVQEMAQNSCPAGVKGYIGTQPPTFQFEANLLGVMPRYC